MRDTLSLLYGVLVGLTVGVTVALLAVWRSATRGGGTRRERRRKVDE